MCALFTCPPQSLERRSGAVPLSPTTGRPASWGLGSMGRVAAAVQQQPRINPHRREVVLRVHKEGTGQGQASGLQLPGTYLAVDPDTGLLYRCSSTGSGTSPAGSPRGGGGNSGRGVAASPNQQSQDAGDQGWPELVGKLTAAGRTLPATTTGVSKVFDALRRIAGDEGRMLQVCGACGLVRDPRFGVGCACVACVDGVCLHMQPYVCLHVPALLPCTTCLMLQPAFSSTAVALLVCASFDSSALPCP